MCYKVIYNNRVVDVLHSLVFLKYSPQLKLMEICEENEAQAVLGSDGEAIWHAADMYNVPVGKYETVELISIDEYEYKTLSMLDGQTPEEIIDAYTLLLIEEGVL